MMGKTRLVLKRVYLRDAAEGKNENGERKVNISLWNATMEVTPEEKEMLTKWKVDVSRRREYTHYGVDFNVFTEMVSFYGGYYTAQKMCIGQGLPGENETIVSSEEVRKGIVVNNKCKALNKMVEEINKMAYLGIATE